MLVKNIAFIQIYMYVQESSCDEMLPTINHKENLT